MRSVSKISRPAVYDALPLHMWMNADFRAQAKSAAGAGHKPVMRVIHRPYYYFWFYFI